MTTSNHTSAANVAWDGSNPHLRTGEERCGKPEGESPPAPDKDEPLITRIGGTPVPHRRSVPHPRYPEPGRR
jgi:hypothetical protein